jgi:DNA-binding NtrC family response regulator
LPKSSSPRKTLAQQLHKTVWIKPMKSKIKIFVIDDDLEMRETLKAFLTRNGYHVDSAKNAAEAFVKLSLEQFDIVLTDVVMTPVSGLLLIRSLMERHIVFQFIVITGNDSYENRDQAQHLGARGYLVKPFDSDELLRLIQTITSEEGENYAECNSDATKDPNRN